MRTLITPLIMVYTNRTNVEYASVLENTEGIKVKNEEVKGREVREGKKEDVELGVKCMR